MFVVTLVLTKSAGDVCISKLSYLYSINLCKVNTVSG